MQFCEYHSRGVEAYWLQTDTRAEQAARMPYISGIAEVVGLLGEPRLREASMHYVECCAAVATSGKPEVAT